MANLNRANLITESATLFPDNNTQEISPADLRSWLEDATTSFVTQKDKSTLENAIFENQGTTLPSAGVVNLNSATGNYLHISGTTTINSFGTCPAGARFILMFEGILILTYNATSLIIPGLANKTTAAGDCCMIISEGSGNWRIVGYFAISGSGGGGSGTVTSITAGTGLNGGTITTSGTIDLANTAVTPAAYTNANITVDAQGRITSAANGTSGAGTVTTTGTPSSGQISKFSGATSITNATAGTDYLAPPSGTAIQKANSGGALANATAGAGGDYVAPGAATGSGLTMATSRLLGRTTASPGAIEEISLTTTGTSGAATLTGGNLNIPQYSGGGGSGTVNSGTSTRLAYYASTGTAVSETTNMAIDNTNGRMNVGGTGVPTARVQAAAGTAANGQVLLTPSVLGSGGLTATTDGMMWYDTTSNNSSLYLRKLYAAATSILTKFITLDRNADFTGASSGIIQSDANGTLSKGADLTALGIFAQTSTVTVDNTATSTTLIGTVTGVTTLPANFFGVGKTIKIFVSGTYNQANGSQDCALKLTIGGVAVGTITFAHNGGLTTKYYDAEFTLTCRTAGASGTLQFMGIGRLNHTGSSLQNYFQVSSTSASINTTGTLAIDLQADWVSADPDNSITASILTATYLN
jgi:hypothetical protein